MPSTRPQSWSSISTTLTDDTLFNPSLDVYPSHPLPTSSSLPASTSPTFPATSLDPGSSLGLGTNPYGDLLAVTQVSFHGTGSLDPDDPLAQSFDFEDIFNDDNGCIPSRPKSSRGNIVSAVDVTDRAPYAAAISRLSRFRDNGKLAPVVQASSRLTSYRNDGIAQPQVPQEKLGGAETRSSKSSCKKSSPTLRLKGSSGRGHILDGPGWKQAVRMSTR